MSCVSFSFSKRVNKKEMECSGKEIEIKQKNNILTQTFEKSCKYNLDMDHHQEVQRSYVMKI